VKKIYLDYASTTPVAPEVLRAMQPYWSKDFANPSSIHSRGVLAKKAVGEARKTVAKFLNAHAREIIFTSGGTEANNIAVFSTVKTADAWQKAHIITTEIEHSSILESCKELERMGLSVSYMKVNAEGLVNPKDLRELIRPETVLVSIGYANGEIGVVQSVKEIIKEIRHARMALHGSRFGYPYLHLDAAQAAQYENMNVEELGADLISIDAQKIYGPKGIGALYIRDGVKIEPTMFGGGQERGLRSGTENVPLIVGFAKALELVAKMKKKESTRLAKIRDSFFKAVKKNIPQAIINGSLTNRLLNNINISIPGEEGEMLVLRLDEAGFIASAASACSSGSGDSPVVRKLAEASGAGVKEIDARAASTLRFTLGRDTNSGDMTKLLAVLKKICKR